MLSRQNRYLNLKIALLSIVIFFIGVTHGLSQSQKALLSPSAYDELRIFSEVFYQIQKDYVEKTNPRDLIYGAIKGMLDTLDPHSGFMPPEIYKEMLDETTGRFEGLGIEITAEDGIPTVVAPIEDTPAEKARILAGDRILMIDGEMTKNLTLMDCIKKMRGPKGSQVTISIMREGLNKPMDYTLIRDVIPVRSVRYELLENQYGYIRISQFQEKTNSEFDKALRAIHEQSKENLKGLILDLRNNPGGLLDQAVKVADHFIDSGVIVLIKGRKDEQSQKFFAHSGETLSFCPLVVIVNEGSASASEIVAGAIQDHRRGIILGTQTFGKASVQTVIPLEDGSGLRLTIARYYTPDGRSIQARGITPDIIVKLIKTDEEKEPLVSKMPSEKDLERHLTDAEKGVPEEKENTVKKEAKEGRSQDNQLDRALELLKSWQVFKAIAQRN